MGQLSQAIPRFIEECYPAAVDGMDQYEIISAQEFNIKEIVAY